MRGAGAAPRSADRNAIISGVCRRPRCFARRASPTLSLTWRGAGWKRHVLRARVLLAEGEDGGQRVQPGRSARAEMALEFSDPYRGSPVVPHASEKFFAQYFVGILTATTMVSFPGRLFIPETRPYRHDRDRMVQVLHEGRVRKLNAKGKAPQPAVKTPEGGFPDQGKWAFEDLWQWRSWMVKRTGPAYPSNG